MTVEQVSEIILRSGKDSELPQALAEFEMGISEDTGRLVVGAPNLPPISGRQSHPYQNLEVLTELSDNLGQLLKHLYKNRDFTEVDPMGRPVSRSTVVDRQGNKPYRHVQEVLDEYVSVKMFGAKGDGTPEYDSLDRNPEKIKNETFSILNAIVHTSGNLTATDAEGEYQRKTLFFPAGVYVIDRPLTILPGVKWIGEGVDNTIIYMVDPKQECVAETADGFLSPEDLENYRGGSDGAITSHTNRNINMDRAPSDIHISGITFRHIGNRDVLRLHRASKVYINNSKLESNYDSGSKPNHEFYDFNTDSILISVDSLGGAFPCSDIHISNSTLTTGTYGLLVTDDSVNITFNQTSFQNLYRSISVGEDITSFNKNCSNKFPYEIVCPEVGCGDLPPLQERAGNYRTLGIMGPGGVKVFNSWFYNIQMEGFAVWRNNPEIGCSSIGNSYTYVGEDLDEGGSGGIAITTTPVFFSKCTRFNSSIGDVFSRTCPPNSERERRVWFYYPDPNLVVNAQDPVVWTYGINLGGGYYQSGLSTVELPSKGYNSVIEIPRDMYPRQGHDAFIIEYSLDCKTNVSPKPKRVGTLKIITDGECVDIDDDYQSINGHDSDVVFEVRIRNSIMELMYRNNSGLDYEMRWSSRSWNTEGGVFGPGYGGVYGFNSKCSGPAQPCNPGPCEDPCR